MVKNTYQETWRSSNHKERCTYNIFLLGNSVYFFTFVLMTYKLWSVKPVKVNNGLEWILRNMMLTRRIERNKPRKNKYIYSRSDWLCSKDMMNGRNIEPLQNVSLSRLRDGLFQFHLHVFIRSQPKSIYIYQKCK